MGRAGVIPKRGGRAKRSKRCSTWRQPSELCLNKKIIRRHSRSMTMPSNHVRVNAWAGERYLQVDDRTTRARVIDRIRINSLAQVISKGLSSFDWTCGWGARTPSISRKRRHESMELLTNNHLKMLIKIWIQRRVFPRWKWVWALRELPNERHTTYHIVAMGRKRRRDEPSSSSSVDSDDEKQVVPRVEEVRAPKRARLAQYNVHTIV